MAREASPTLTPNSCDSTTSMGSHMRIEAMLLKAAKLISHRPTGREDVTPIAPRTKRTVYRLRQGCRTSG